MRGRQCNGVLGIDSPRMIARAPCGIIAPGDEVEGGNPCGAIPDMDIVDACVLPRFEQKEQGLHSHPHVIKDDGCRNRDMAPRSLWRLTWRENKLHFGPLSAAHDKDIVRRFQYKRVSVNP